MTSSLLTAQKSLWKLEFTISAEDIAPVLQGNFRGSLPLFLNQAAITSEIQYTKRGAKMGLWVTFNWFCEPLRLHTASYPSPIEVLLGEHEFGLFLWLNLLVLLQHIFCIKDDGRHISVPGNSASVHGQVVSGICLNQLLNC